MTVRFFIYLVLLFSGVIIGIVRYKTLTIPFKILVFFLAYTFCSEITGRILIYNLKSSFPVYHFYVVLSTTFFQFIYFSFFQNKQIKLSIAILSVLFIVFSTINSIYVQPLFSFPSNSIIVSDVIIVIYSLLLFRFLLRQQSASINKTVTFFNTLVLFYFVVQLFNWGLYDYLIKKKYNTKIISDFGYIVNVIYYFGLNIILFRSRKID